MLIGTSCTLFFLIQALYSGTRDSRLLEVKAVPYKMDHLDTESSLIFEDIW